MAKEFELESERLKEVKELFEEEIMISESRLRKLPEIYREDPEMLYNMSMLYGNRVSSLKRNYDKPYFARIDFKSDDEENVNECYLGKVGLIDENNNPVTVDWRAPIASIYYDSSIGKASYEAPEGTIDGYLSLKRQYEIDNGQLLDYRDVDTVSNDEILKPYLNVNADNRLKNIVASIQSEQNDIIREKINNNIIVQGVAGSGKTTVALHRVAYLVYNYMNKIMPNQYIVIGPNKFFVNYISSVLPDLDVSNVSQLTYDELVKNYLKEDFLYVSGEKKLLKSISNVDEMFYEKMKTSLLYKNALDKFINDYTDKIFDGRDLEMKGYSILNGNMLCDLYNDIKDDPIYQDSLNKIVDRVSLMVSKYIEDNRDSIHSNIRKQFNQKTVDLDREEMLNERKKMNSVEQEIDKNCKKCLKKYFSKSEPKILPLYVEFLKNINNYCEIENYDIKKPVAENISNLKKKQIEFEDLSALMHLKYKLQGSGELERYKHVVIDEAQDFGNFNFYVLREIMNKSTFSIFGDLAQSIYQYRGISDWDDVVSNTFNNDCNMKYLLKSYRTTVEIMNSANNITSYINLEKANPVIRHGKEVEYVDVNEQRVDLIADFITNSIKNNYQSVAIITKTEEEASEISEVLKKIGIEIENINFDNTKYNGGICAIPSYLAKGLEFDSVIIYNASEDNYDSSKIIDMKLLYVAMTRALHELKVLYSGNISKPLIDECNKVRKR